MSRVRDSARCGHCNGQTYIEAIEGEFGVDRTAYILVCLQCSRVQGAAQKPSHGYRGRLWYRARGLSAETLAAVKGGQTQFVWEVSS